MNVFKMDSNTGMGLLVVSTILMLWASFYTGKSIPGGMVEIIAIIFAGKTTHGIMTYRADRKDGTLGSQD